jgi:uncharacterized protein YjbI with pentapeptide repeats
MLFAIVLCILLVFLLFWLLLWKLPQWQVAVVPEAKDRIDLESKSRQTIAQIVGGAVLLVGLYFTSQTLRTTQEGQITDRFTKAITQLGDNNLAVRLGGIYALERLAKDSASDHWSVMEVLTAFVREYSHGRSNPPWAWVSMLFVKDRLPEDQAEPSTPADVQAILTVIGRRTRTLGNGETQYLDLRNANLQGANLAKAQLQGANLAKAQLQKAYLGEAQLQDANLVEAQLQDANLAKAQLQGAYLMEAQLQGANLAKAQLQDAYLAKAQLQDTNLEKAQLQKAYLRVTQLQGANLAKAQLQDTILEKTQLQGAILTATENLTQYQIDMACIDENTKLPEGLTRPPPCPTHP